MVPAVNMSCSLAGETGAKSFSTPGREVRPPQFVAGRIASVTANFGGMPVVFARKKQFPPHEEIAWSEESQQPWRLCLSTDHTATSSLGYFHFSFARANQPTRELRRPSDVKAGSRSRT